MTVLVAIALGTAARLGDERANAALPPEPGAAARILSSQRLLLHGQVRCAATVKPEVEVGRAVSVGLTLHNVSKHPVTVSLGVFTTDLVVHAADGTTYDNAALDADLVGIPPPTPATLRPGTTRRLWSIDVPVRWSGPLRIAPECLGKALPALRVKVTAPGPPPDDGTAIADVVAASGHLLDHCSPQMPGVAVYGQIYAPTGDAPPLEAQCSVSLTPEGAFSVAQVLVTTPSLVGVQIYEPYVTLWPIGDALPLASNPPYEAIAWEFVVTRDGAIPVAAASQAASNDDSSQMAQFWDWNGTGFEQDGSGTCGGTGFSWGGTGPDIEFISVCPS